MEMKVYQLTISDNEQDDNEVDFVSLVDNPAIMRDFLAFKEQEPKVKFAIQNEDRRIVSGPAMIPDIPIYRRDDQLGEYYVVFDKDTIEKIAYRFFKKGYQSNINTDHSREAMVADSVFYESWVVDRTRGKMPMLGFEDVPEGTWFLTAKINSEETWNRIKSGEFRGFSVEGLFEYNLAEDFSEEEALLTEIEELLSKAVKKTTGKTR